MQGFSRAVARVEHICGEGGEPLALRLALVEELRRAVPFDAYAWLLTDPETEVGSAPLADVPGLPLPVLPELIRLKYLTPVNRWTKIRGRVAVLSQVTNGKLERSLVWRQLLGSYGVTDVASLVFRDPFGCWGFLELWRQGVAETFTGAEAEFLVSIAPPITGALRRSVAQTFSASPAPAIRMSPIVLLLSPALDVKAQTPDAEEYLKVLVPPADALRAIPAGAYNVGAQLLAVEAGIDEHPPFARVHLDAGIWMTLRAARIGNEAAGGQNDIAVTIEQASPAERLGVFVRAFGLTPREREVVERLSRGADTRQVAGELSLSEFTVQDHLKSVFVKTGTRTRATLLALATGD